MRGAVTYNDIMLTLTAEDKEIISRIAEENIEQTSKSRIPMI